MKTLVTSHKKSNTSIIDLNNKIIPLLVAAISLYLDYQYSSVRSPRLVLIVNSWTPSKAFHLSSLEMLILLVEESNGPLFLEEYSTLTKLVRELT